MRNRSRARLQLQLRTAKNAKYIFLSATLDDDPDLADKKFPGNPTKSYRSTHPFKVVGEVTAWEGHSIEQVTMMKEHLEKLKERGIDSLND